MAQVTPSDDELFDVISKEALIDRASLTRDANLEDLGIASLDVIACCSRSRKNSASWSRPKN
jgi:hypothetical protein